MSGPGIGDIPVITTTWRNADGDLETPETLNARYLKPSGVAGTVTPTEASTGVTETVLPEVDESGRWYWWIDGNGTADDGYFDVTPAPAAT